MQKAGFLAAYWLKQAIISSDTANIHEPYCSKDKYSFVFLKDELTSE